MSSRYSTGKIFAQTTVFDGERGIAECADAAITDQIVAALNRQSDDPLVVENARLRRELVLQTGLALSGLGGAKDEIFRLREALGASILRRAREYCVVQRLWNPKDSDSFDRGIRLLTELLRQFPSDL